MMVFPGPIGVSESGPMISAVPPPPVTQTRSIILGISASLLGFEKLALANCHRLWLPSSSPKQKTRAFAFTSQQQLSERKTALPQDADSASQAPEFSIYRSHSEPFDSWVPGISKRKSAWDMQDGKKFVILAGAWLCKSGSALPKPFVVVQSLSHVSLSVTSWTATCQASLSITIPWSLLKFMSTESVMPSNHLTLYCPLILLSSIFPSIWVFFNELVLHIRWPKYWSFNFSISPSSEYSGLISFRID